jgi:hypothetical protein
MSKEDYARLPVVEINSSASGNASVPASQREERLRKIEEEQVKKNTLVFLSLETTPQPVEIGHAFYLPYREKKD